MLLSVQGARDLAQLARDMREAGDPQKLRRDLRRDIAAAMKPMKQAVQANERAIPAHGPRHTGLRDDMVKATRIRVLAGSSRAEVKLEVAPARMPAGKRKLPSYMEGRGRWRHPVFGDRDRWVSQSGHPYFWRAVRPHIEDVRKTVIDVVERALSKI